jgi:serine/threonine protein kinase
MLYEMACGKLPFEGPTPSHTIVAILEHETSQYEHPSVELRQIITTALQKDRQLRFQTADAMADALDAAKHRLGYISDQHVSAAPTAEPFQPPVAVPSPVVEKPAKASNKFLWLVPVALAVLVIAALGVFGVVALLLRSSSAANSNTSAPVVVAPSPTPTIVTVAVPESTATPIATPETVYVEPTPQIPVQEDRTTTETGQRDTGRKTTARAEPTRAPVQREPKPAPTRKPKPNQDPNCVFTNSCH